VARTRGIAAWGTICAAAAAAPAAVGAWTGGVPGAGLAAASATVALVTFAILAAGDRLIRAPLPRADMAMRDGTLASSARAVRAQLAMAGAGAAWIALGIAGIGAAAAQGWVAPVVLCLAPVAIGWLVARAGWKGVKNIRAVRHLNAGEAESALAVAGAAADPALQAEVALRTGDVHAAIGWLEREIGGGLHQNQVRNAELRLALGDLAVARAVLAGPAAADPVGAISREPRAGRLLIAEGRGAEIPPREDHWRALAARLPRAYGDGLVLLRVAGHEAGGNQEGAAAALADLSLPLARYAWWGLVWPEVWALVARAAGPAAPPIPPRPPPTKVVDTGPFAAPSEDAATAFTPARRSVEGIAPVGIAGVWAPRSRMSLLRSLIGASSALSLGFFLPPLILLAGPNLLGAAWMALVALLPLVLLPALAGGAWLAWVPDRSPKGDQLVLDSGRRIATHDFAGWRIAGTAARASGGLLLALLGLGAATSGLAWVGVVLVALLVLAWIGSAKHARNARLAWSAHVDPPAVWAAVATRAISGFASLAADRDGARAWLALAHLFEGNVPAARKALSDAETHTAEVAWLDGWIALAEGRPAAVRALSARVPGQRESERFLHAVFGVLRDLAEGRAAAVVARAPELRALADRHVNRFGSLLSSLVDAAEGRAPPPFVVACWPFAQPV
jgi:hypothetical protein